MNDMDMAPPCVMFTMPIIDIRSGNTVNHYPGDSFADKPNNPAPLQKNVFFEQLSERNGAIRSGSLQRAVIPITTACLRSKGGVATAARVTFEAKDPESAVSLIIQTIPQNSPFHSCLQLLIH